MGLEHSDLGAGGGDLAGDSPISSEGPAVRSRFFLESWPPAAWTGGLWAARCGGSWGWGRSRAVAVQNAVELAMALS